jgi:LysM repeat protein
MQTTTQTLFARGCALTLLLAAGFAATGCVTAWDEPRTDLAREELLRQQAQREAAMLRNRMDGMEQALARLVERLDRLEVQSRDNVRLRDEIASLHKEVAQVRAEREAMRKEIVDDLTTRINKYMATISASTAAAGRTSPVKQNGYMHTVVAGQKLADIAKAYKTTPTAIRKANGLKDDSLKAGQTLFIPE